MIFVINMITMIKDDGSITNEAMIDSGKISYLILFESIAQIDYTDILDTRHRVYYKANEGRNMLPEEKFKEEYKNNCVNPDSAYFLEDAKWEKLMALMAKGVSAK